MKKPIKVMLIDNHVLFRKGVAQVISENPSFKIVGESSSGHGGLDMAQQASPDMVLINIDTKVINSSEILRVFKASLPDICLIVLTASDAGNDLPEALNDGADGYLLKSIDPEDLCDMLLKIFSEASLPDSSVTYLNKNSLLETRAKENTNDWSLTGREHEILELLANGLNNKAIATELGIAVITVKTHVKNLLRKMNMNSRLQAAIWKHQLRSNAEFTASVNCP